MGICAAVNCSNKSNKAKKHCALLSFERQNYTNTMACQFEKREYPD